MSIGGFCWYRCIPDDTVEKLQQSLKGKSQIRVCTHPYKGLKSGDWDIPSHLRLLVGPDFTKNMDIVKSAWMVSRQWVIGKLGTLLWGRAGSLPGDGIGRLGKSWSTQHSCWTAACDGVWSNLNSVSSRCCKGFFVFCFFVFSSYP